MFNLKGLMLAASLAVSGLASAATTTVLQIPDVVPLSGTSHCTGLAFDANDILSGVCSSYTTQNAGRFSYNYTYTVYAVEWTPGETVTGDRYPVTGTQVIAATYVVKCGTAYKPGVQPIQWTYLPGFNASNCQIASVAPFGVTATSADGLYDATLGYSGAALVAN